MKTKISKILLVVAILMAPFLLGGCKKKCPTVLKNIPGTSTFREDCPFTDPNAGATGKRELNFYFVYDNTDAFKQQLQAFQSQNPGVTIRTKKFVNLKEYEDTIVNEIAEGAGPDVFMIHNSWITKHAKKLLPMPVGLPVSMTPDQFRQTFFQAASSDLLIDNQVYGMPLAMDNLAVYYNKAYFRDLLATTDRPADLWEAIKDQVFQLTKRNNSPERFQLAGIGIGRSDNVARSIDTLYTMMLQYGVKFYDDKEENATFANSGKANAQGIENPGELAMTLYTSFGLPTYKNYSWNDTITGYAPAEMEAGSFVRGKVAMILGYPYLYDNLVLGIQNAQRAGGQHVDISDIGIAPMPQLVTGTEATKRDTLASYYPLVVARTTKFSQDAWNLVQFLTNADSQQTYHKVTKHPTSRMDLVTEQQTEPLFGVFAYQAPFAKSFKIYDEEAYAKVFGDAIQKVVMNTSSAKEALMEAQTKITCVIKKQKKIISGDEDCGI
jgi:ABC-type glycerol-3-phosphate transport system substrate-binding protein